MGGTPAGTEHMIQVPADPKAAIDAILDERIQLTTQVAQLTRLNDELRSESAVKDERLKKMEPYEDIINQKQHTLTCYIRDKALVTKMKIRLRELYGPLADLGTRKENGQFTGARLMDHLVQECVWYGVMIKFHEIKARMEIDDNVSGLEA